MIIANDSDSTAWQTGCSAFIFLGYILCICYS